MDQAAADSRRLLEESEEHMREKMEISLSLQKHRELAEQAEIATQEKIRQLRMRRTRDDVRCDQVILFVIFLLFLYCCIVH